MGKRRRCLTLRLVAHLGTAEIYVVVPQSITTNVEGRFSHHRHARLTHFKLTQFKRYSFMSKQLKKTIFVKSPLNVSLLDRKRNDTTVMEVYCWATTRAAGLSCCGRSCSKRFGVWILSAALLWITHMYSWPRLC